jgi:hypothetical protein
MNMKPRMKLKIEFKQFQRLPEWPVIIRSADAGRRVEEASVRKIPMVPLPIEQDRFGVRSLAE